MGRTLPYPRIYPKRPTASLVSKKVLASIIGQIVITSAVQFWAFFWVRRTTFYSPPDTHTKPDDDNHLEAKNYENSVLFMVSCFQYILVAAVFSIGPPYRKSIWTNGVYCYCFINQKLTVTPFRVAHVLSCCSDRVQSHSALVPSTTYQIYLGTHDLAILRKIIVTSGSHHQRCAFTHLRGMGNASGCSCYWCIAQATARTSAGQRGESLQGSRGRDALNINLCYITCWLSQRPLMVMIWKCLELYVRECDEQSGCCASALIVSVRRKAAAGCLAPNRKFSRSVKYIRTIRCHCVP